MILHMLYIITILLFAGTVSAGTWETLSSQEKVLFDLRSVTPSTPGQPLPTGNGYTNNSHLYADRDSFQSNTIFNTTWFNTIDNYPGGPHTSSNSYKYLGFTDSGCYHEGSCLFIRITGGDVAGGFEHQKRELYFAEPEGTRDGSGISTGSYFYVFPTNTSFNSAPQTRPPFPESQFTVGNPNRMSFYFKPGPGTSNAGANYPDPTFNIGPYFGGTNHAYVRSYLNDPGSGWWKFQADNKPHHINTGKDGLPPIDQNYITTDPTFISLWPTFYVQMPTTSGNEYASVPFDELISPFIFWEDTEEQNEETINGLAVMWHPENHYGEISFESKYLEAASSGLYELRYSFSPITNANWPSAIPAHINEYAPFNIDARTDGIFIRPVPSRSVAWARFDLASTVEEDSVEAGTEIYFALKDIGQVGGNTNVAKTGAACLGTRWTPCGTDYAGTGGTTFDFTTDQPDLDLIKRISYKLPGGGGSQQNGRVEFVNVSGKSTMFVDVPGKTTTFQ